MHKRLLVHLHKLNITTPNGTPRCPLGGRPRAVSTPREKCFVAHTSPNANMVALVMRRIERLFLLAERKTYDTHQDALRGITPQIRLGPHTSLCVTTEVTCRPYGQLWSWAALTVCRLAVHNAAFRHRSRRVLTRLYIGTAAFLRSNLVDQISFC